MFLAAGGPACAQAPDPSQLTAEDHAKIRKWADCSVEAIKEADRLNIDSENILKIATMACGRFWTGLPAGDQQLYEGILSSVRAGNRDPEPRFSAPVPLPPTDKRM
jgi:hypothetical protein